MSKGIKLLKDISIDKENLMLVNVLYHRGNKDTQYKDCIDIIYKDTRTGERYLNTIEEPAIIAYLVKEEYRDYNYHKEYIEIDKCSRHLVPIKRIPDWIAKQAGPEYINWLKYNRCNNYSAVQNIHKWRYVFGTDIDPRAFYISQWRQFREKGRFSDDNLILNVGAADIETDAKKLDTFASHGEVPVLCATFIDEHARTSHTVYYRAKDNMEQISKFEKNIDKFVKKCHDEFDESYGKFDYLFYGYDDELTMIKDYFTIKNSSSCDVIMYWNMKFDFNFLYDRIIALGGDPIDIICDPAFKYKDAYYKHDRKNFQIINKRDFVTTSTFHQYIDQMLLYAQTRKGIVTLRSSKLNVIAKSEIKDSKLDYSEENNIRDFPYINYEKYILYNIKDVLLQIGIERKTGDIQSLYANSYLTCTPYDSVFSRTKLLTNNEYHEYLEMGLIPCNNNNIHYGADKEDKTEMTFDGALVGDTKLLDGSLSGELILGKRSNKIFSSVIDFDYRAMYPYAKITHNIGPSCLIAKLLVNETVSDLAKLVNKALAERNNKNDDTDETRDEFEYIEDDAVEIDDQGSAFLDDYQTGDILSMCSRWFNLPTVDDMVEIINKDRNIQTKVDDKSGDDYYLIG